MSQAAPSFEVHREGEKILCNFVGQTRPSPTLIQKMNDALNKEFQAGNCKAVVCDLTGLEYFPSQMIGFLVSLHNRGMKIHLLNPNSHIVETLKIAQLEKLFDFGSPQ